jgi:hypothetical protein
MPQQGSKLTASPGTWTGSGALAYAYQWYRCDGSGAHCSSIHGATRGTYTQVAKDVAHTLALTVRATDATGTNAAYAPLIGLVTGRTSTLVARGQPAVTGEPIVGRPLQVAAAEWTGVPGAAAFVWRRCNANGRICQPITGATAETYTIAADDVGHLLLATVTASKQTVFSLTSAVVRAVPGPVAAGRPSIAGTFQQGKKLVGNAGTWASGGTITYAYQWYRCDANGAHCSLIRGATLPTYTQVAADVSHTLGLTVRATDATGTTAAYSSLAGIVAPTSATFAAAVQPSLTGAPVAGQQLKVTGGTFTATPSGATYAWLRCNANGRLCAAIAGATTDSYTVTAADAGHTLVAVVTASAGAAKQVVLTTAAAIPA